MLTMRTALAAALTAGQLLAVEIVGHRGASYDAPENTLPSVELGFEQEADAVEVDVYLSKDGKVVVLHDDNTRRVAGVDRKVVDQTAAELTALDAGLWKGAQWKGTKIPLLSEVLELVPAGKKLVVEIKCGPEILPELERVLDASGKRDQNIIISFNYNAITGAKELMPDLPAYWLYGFSSRERSHYGITGLDDLIQRAKDGKLDGLDIKYDGPFDAAFVEKLSKGGMELYVYTVNDPAVAKKLAAMGVKGITTDRPGWLREQLEAR
jgi:glycerophosphoryl diester phosphodiesterase